VRFLFNRDQTVSQDPASNQFRLKDLYDLGRRIDRLKRWELFSNYRNIVFTTPFGGELMIHGPLNLPIISHSKEINLCGTRAVYSLRATIRARKLKEVVDLDNYPIYEASNGVLFVFRYSEPAPGKLSDTGVFASPNLKLDIPSTFEEGFKGFALRVLEQVNAIAATNQLSDPLFTISVVNRLVEAQRLAFIQGTQATDPDPNAITPEETQGAD
jgi:hypothetical protein